MSFDFIVAFCGSLAVTSFIGVYLLSVLRKLKAGQSIKEDGPSWHKGKEGTPTMGGLMFIAGTAFICLLWNFLQSGDRDYAFLLVLLFGFIYAIIGFYDDYRKLNKKQNLGLKVLPKFALQLAVAVLLLLLMRYTGYLMPEIYVPFLNITLSIPEPVYFAFAALVIVGTVNAVNITDGADGLVTGVSLPIALFFSAIAFLWGYASIGILSAALTGGLVAFLIFNFHPAKMFMGDTGSLFIGGIIAATAFVLNMPLILLPLGIVFLIETLSDIIQVLYFKLSKGKRVFKMAPLHHHFEMSGWNEYVLFSVFTGVSLIFAVVSYFGVIGRYV